MDAVVSCQIRFSGKRLVAFSKVTDKRPGVHVMAHADFVIVVHELWEGSGIKSVEESGIDWGRRGGGGRCNDHCNVVKSVRERGAGWRRCTTGMDVAFWSGSGVGGRSLKTRHDKRSAYGRTVKWEGGRAAS